MLLLSAYLTVSLCTLLVVVLLVVPHFLLEPDCQMKYLDHT